MIRKSFCLILLSLFVIGCSSTKLVNVNEEGFSLEEDERRLMIRSNELQEELEASGQTYEDQELEEYLNRLARELLPDDFKADHLNFYVKVIRDPNLNAFALPNGFIYFHTAMLAIMENEAQLATVLAHEMTHVLNRHRLKERRSTTNKTAFFVTTAAIEPFLSTLGALTSLSGYSQHLELEADNVGFEMMKRKNYDLRESAEFFRKIEEFIKEEKVRQPFFFSSHPKVLERVRNFEQLVEAEDPENIGTYTNDEEFHRIMRPLKMDAINIWLQAGMYKAAEMNIDRYIEQYPEDKQAFYLKGELFRQRQDVPTKKVKKRNKEEDYAQALAAFEQAIALDERFANAYEGKGRVLFKMNQKSQAKVALEHYLQLNPEAPNKAYIEQTIQELSEVN